MKHLVAGGALFLFPWIARAQTGTEGFQNSLNLAAGASGLAQVQTPAEIVGSFINVILSLAGIALVCILVYAGILYMQGGQDEGKIKQAKGLIVNSVIGLVLILSAFAISTFVIDALVGALT